MSSERVAHRQFRAQPRPDADLGVSPRATILAGHLPALDGVRGLAIVLVLLHNFGFGGPVDSVVAKLVQAGMEIGWGGVQLFFVLSGFLITGILVDTKTAPHYYRSFYARRMLRIFPLYYFVLVAWFLVMPWAGGEPLRARPGDEYQWWLWAYLSNWSVALGHALPAFSHFWSLAVEEQFYLVWPFVVHALDRRALLRVCLGLSAAALVLRIALGLAGTDPALIYQLTPCRMDGLAVGAAVALVLRDPDLLRRVRPHLGAVAWASGLVMFALTVITRGLPAQGFWTQTLGYSALAVLCATFVAYVVLLPAEGGQSSLVRWLEAPPLRTLGKYSYGLYVFHRPLHLLAVGAFGSWLTAEAGLRHLPYVAGYFLAASAATFVAAFLSYHLVEKHFLLLKGRFAAGRDLLDAKGDPRAHPAGASGRHRVRGGHGHRQDTTRAAPHHGVAEAESGEHPGEPT